MFNLNYYKLVQYSLTGAYGSSLINSEVVPSLVNNSGYTGLNTTYGHKNLLLSPEGLGSSISSMITLPIQALGKLAQYSSSVPLIFADTNISSGCLVLSDGTTPPTINDITISGSSIDISNVSYSQSRQIDYIQSENSYYSIINLIIVNNKPSQLRFSEISHHFVCGGSDTANNNLYKGKATVMLFRTVVPEIIIPSNGARQITLRTKVPQYNPYVPTPE